MQDPDRPQAKFDREIHARQTRSKSREELGWIFVAVSALLGAAIGAAIGAAAPTTSMMASLESAIHAVFGGAIGTGVGVLLGLKARSRLR